MPECAALVFATDRVSRTNRKNENSKARAKRGLALYDPGGRAQGGKLAKTEGGNGKEKENGNGKARVPIVPRFYLLIALSRTEYFAQVSRGC